MQDLLFVLRSRLPQLLFSGFLIIAVLGLSGQYSPGSSDRNTCEDECNRCLKLIRGGGYSYSAAYGQIPLSFEANEGQVPSEYSFVAHGAAYDSYFAPRGVLIAMHSTTGAANRQVRISFGGGGASTPHGVDILPTRTNYFIGNDPARWQTNVPSFGRIRYERVFPGVDVAFYGRRKQLENDFIVQPGADPAAVSFQVAGADSVAVDSAGDLVVQVAGEELRWKKPGIYQEDGGGQKWIDGGYVVGPANTVKFRVGAYDRTRALVIDPVLVFSTYMGRNLDETGIRIALDAAGNIVVGGVTTSNNFPVVNSLDPPVGRSTTDAFVIRVSPDGATLLSSTVIGGNRRTVGAGLALDGAGNIYLAGATIADDYPTTKGVFQPAYAGGGDLGSSVGDGFITKLDPSASKILYSTFLGGSDSDGIAAIAVDAQGNAYVTGGTTSNNFPVSSNAFQSFYRGSSNNAQIKVGDAFVTKINPNATAIVYSTLLGGSGDDAPSSIVVDAGGVAYVGGYTGSTNFPVLNAAIPAFKGSGGQEYTYFGDGFISAIKPDGSGLVYSTYLGGRFDDGVTALALDKSGALYATGYTLSTDFPLAGNSAQTTNHGSGTNVLIHPGDGFLTKFDKNGAIVYSTYLGGAGDDSGLGVATDGAGNVYVTGFTNSSDFPLTAPVQNTNKGGGGQPYLRSGDAFVTQFNPAGAIVFSTFIGGSKDDGGVGIVVDSGGSIYITGNTMSLDFPVTAGVLQRGFAGASGGGYAAQGDAFIVKLGTAATIGVSAVVSAASYGLPPVAPGQAVTVYGFGMGPDALTLLALDASGNVATTLGGARLLFDGVPAPLIYVSAKQSSAFVPYAVDKKTTTMVQAEYNGVRSAALSIAVAPSAPGFFSADSSGKGQGAIANEDGTYNSAANPAAAGSVITLYGTGEGQTLPPGVDGRVAATVFPKPVLPVSITIGGQPATDIPYYGAAPSSSAGVFQVNVRIPASAQSGNQTILVTVGAATSAPLTVAVR